MVGVGVEFWGTEALEGLVYGQVDEIIVVVIFVLSLLFFNIFL